VPHSVFTGRVVEPGEPLFLVEDTDGAVALAEEERATCPSCGLPRVWCRDPANQFAFEPREQECFAAKRLAQHRSSQAWESKHEDTRQATELLARFRDGHQPDIEAGLELVEDDAEVVQQHDG
jgi:hypothetical protein